MRAPHPSLRGLYRQAATPSQVMARLKAHDELLLRLDAEVIAGGAGGDELLVRLTQGLGLGEVLNRALSRVSSSAQGEGDPSTSLGMTRSVVPLPSHVSSRASVEGSPSAQGEGDPSTSLGMTRSFVPPSSHVSSRASVEGSPSARREGDPSTSLGMTRAVVPPSSRVSPSAQREGDPATSLGMTRGSFEPLSREDAYEALSQRAARRGLIDAFHQPVAREVSPRVEVLLQEHSIEFTKAPVPPPRREATPDPQEPMQRLAATVERAERATSRRAANAPAIAAASERIRPPIRILRDESERAAIPIAALQRAGRAQASAPPIGGFRGLVALVESQRPATAAPPPLAPPRQIPPPALDDAALTARISEILRRDAERHGIDTTGGEP